MHCTPVPHRSQCSQSNCYPHHNEGKMWIPRSQHRFLRHSSPHPRTSCTQIQPTHCNPSPAQPHSMQLSGNGHNSIRHYRHPKQSLTRMIHTRSSQVTNYEHNPARRPQLHSQWHTCCSAEGGGHEAPCPDGNARIANCRNITGHAPQSEQAMHSQR